MAYQHIDNLYRSQEILMLVECFALEKIHGTSAHISYKTDKNIGLFAGGADHSTFSAIFDMEKLEARFKDMALPPNRSVHIYGEAYGGKMQGMSALYGPNLRFVAFEVKIGDTWLNVLKAEAFTLALGLEFVHYVRIPCTMEAIDAQRDADSVQAIRNGMGEGHHREGIVLRPIEEVTLNNGKRIVAKHKRDEFRETTMPRKVVSPERLQVIAEAKAIATEWVTMMRLYHVLDKAQIEVKLENTGAVIKIMTEDILREAEGEIVDSPDARKHIGRETALMFKEHIRHEAINKAEIIPDDTPIATA